MQVRMENSELVIRIPLEKPKLSTSGKTLIVVELQCSQTLGPTPLVLSHPVASASSAPQCSSLWSWGILAALSPAARY